MIWGALISSFILNVFCLWYIRNLIRDYFYVLENMEDLFDSIDGLTDHLESVHSLETFYGEPTLQRLIEHSKTVVEDVKALKGVLAVGDDNEEKDDTKAPKEDN